LGAASHGTQQEASDRAATRWSLGPSPDIAANHRRHTRLVLQPVRGPAPRDRPHLRRSVWYRSNGLGLSPRRGGVQNRAHAHDLNAQAWTARTHEVSSRPGVRPRVRSRSTRSRHPNGGFYGWAPYLSPWDVDLLPLPTEVVEAVQRPRVPPPKGGAAGRGVKAPEAVGTSNPAWMLTVLWPW